MTSSAPCGRKLELLSQAQAKHPEYFPKDFSPDPEDILLEDGGDFSFFEKEGKGVYQGHYFFLGRPSFKEALRKARNMINAMFDEHQAVAIKGLTPSNHSGALRLTKALGFEELGTTRLKNGVECCVFFMHRNERFKNGLSDWEE